MPYIKPEARGRIIEGGHPETVGELNYAITQLVLDYLDTRAPNHAPSYAHYNEVLGVLEAVKLELYRRCVAPYEARKCAENGDCYP